MYPELVTLEKDPAELDRWVHANWDSHFRIVVAIKQKTGRILNIYPIQSIREGDRENWLFMHQQFHNDMNLVLGISGSDLLDVDFKNDDQRNAWAWLHQIEHFKASNLLGIP